MNLHEYQAKKILKKRGIPIPDFGVASTIEEAKQVVDALGLDEAVVKIQVHAGGRGKAGGVKLAKKPTDILSICKDLIGMKLVNNQTGPGGVIANKVLLTSAVSIQKEYYLGAAQDRERGCPILIASPEGGVEIEEVAKKNPEKILKLPFSIQGGLRSYQLIRFCQFMGFKGEMAKRGAMIAEAVAKAFIDIDASLIEINPLVTTPKGEIWALDAKIQIDDNALYRQKEIAAYYDPTQLTQMERMAKEYDLAYIAMDGNIGCMVNGAGLAMATMDIIKICGGRPANFLDVGGGASKEKIAAGFRIILSDPKVKAILINIFGGIMNCETLAEGILHAAKEYSIHVPLVVRMEGTHVEKGKKLLADSGLKSIPADTLHDAAKKVVEQLHGHTRK